MDFYYVDVSTTSKFEKFWNLRLPAEARQVTYSGSSGGWGAVNEIPAPAALKAGKTYYVRVAAFFDSGRQIIYTKTVKFKVKSP